MTMEGMAPEDVLRMEQENKMTKTEVIRQRLEGALANYRALKDPISPLTKQYFISKQILTILKESGLKFVPEIFATRQIQYSPKVAHADNIKRARQAALEDINSQIEEIDI